MFSDSISVFVNVLYYLYIVLNNTANFGHKVLRNIYSNIQALTCISKFIFMSHYQISFSTAGYRSKI